MRDHANNRVMVTPSVLYATESAVAAIDGGEGGFIHVRYDGVFYGDGWGGTCPTYPWRIFGTDGTEIGSSSDTDDEIRGAVDAPPDALKAMGSMINFLLACAESKSEESENYTLFDGDVRAWAETYSDELSMIAVEISEELGENA